MTKVKNKFRAVIFDLDDTLLKTAEIKWQHHKHTAKKHYGVELTEEVLAEHWGKPFPELVGHLYQHSDTTENMIAANRVDEADFPKEIQQDTKEALGRLKAHDLILGIVTAINAEFAVNDLSLVGVHENEFLFVQGANDSKYHKPDPKVFDPALEKLANQGITKNEIVYVGDTLSDFYASRDAGIHFIGVSTGFASISDFKNEGAEAAENLSTAAELILS